MSADELGPGREQQPEQTNVDTTEVKEENCDNHECPEGHGVILNIMMMVLLVDCGMQ